MENNRVLVAMSGGVDSSVAALLLIRQGYDVVGMTAELFGDASAAGPCCGREGGKLAAEVCTKLGFVHHHIDLTELFESQVINHFIGEYQAGRTPNPCSDCNRFLKFDKFFELADELDCHYLATGHHARIIQGQGNSNGQALLANAEDPAKDQTYFLACIEPHKLSRILFPVGDYAKSKVRKLALEAELPSATRKESQDICFISNQIGLVELMEWHTGKAPTAGKIVTEDGKVLGTHPGVEHFTIGQRKGLSLGGGTEGLVVHKLEPSTHTVVVAQREAHPVQELVLTKFTDLAPGMWDSGTKVNCRARYRQKTWEGVVQRTKGGAVVTPSCEIFSLSAGQMCVGYQDNIVLFGGVIDQIGYVK